MNNLFFKIISIFLCFFYLPIIAYCSDIDSYNVKNAINRYNNMAPEKLFATGESFMNRNLSDSAMICFSLIYNNWAESKNKETQQIICKALNRASTIYISHCNYQMGLELLLKALDICETIDYKDYIGRIYNNIGDMYCRLKDFKTANRYFNLAYKNSSDNFTLGAALNNLGMIAHLNQKMDSALLLYREVLSIKVEVNDLIYNGPLNNIALIFGTLKQYDSAFFYYNKGLSLARTLNNVENEAKILSNIGKVHLDLKDMDSALYYFNLSSIIAEKANLLNILSDNYLLFSEIEDIRGNLKASYDYYKKYSELKDSLSNLPGYSTLNEVQFTYGMFELDKQIKELNAEQKAKERTIVMQRRFQIAMGLVLLTVVIFLIMLYLKNKTLNAAYNLLVAKNLEIINSDKINYQSKLDYEERLKEKELIIEQLNEQKICSETTAERNSNNGSVKNANIGLNIDTKRELELAILDVMNNKKAFCDPDFSLTKLSEMLGSNFNYISHIINSSFNSNFKTFIHEYRIKEACNMFSDPAFDKYSIETIANMVGFKSKGSFNPIFKEITGVTPSFYIKSLKNKQ